MRNFIWASLIAFAAGSILVSSGLPSLQPGSGLGGLDGEFEQTIGTRASGPPSPPVESERRRDSDEAKTRAPALATPSEQDKRVSAPDLPLAEASPREIRRVLEEAIDRAEKTRGLRVHPAIVETVIRDGAVRVVFEIDASSTSDTLTTRLAEAQPRAMIDDLRVFPLLSHGAARIDSAALLALIESGATPSIELDGIHRASLLESMRLIEGDLAHELEFDGDGSVVAILDSGVESTHPFFADRIVEEACFSVLGQCPNDASQMFGPGAARPCLHDNCKHGTHVAGIAVGRDPASPLVGVAPNAGLIAIQIFSEFDDDIGAYSSDILAAFQHLLGLAPFYRIASVNLSIGGDPQTSTADCDRASAAQHAAVELLRSLGITTVAASGNEGLTNAVSSPACLSNVIGVGSTDDLGRVSGFTNSATFLSVLAPGQFVESAALDGAIRSASGTSMAAPHVAGAVAVIREAYPGASVSEIENAILLSGVPTLDERNGETLPRIEIQSAIDLLTASALAPPDSAPSPVDEGDANPSSAVATSVGGGGGGGCGLVGIEPFLALALIRLSRRMRHT